MYVDSIPVTIVANTSQSAPFNLAQYQYAGIHVGKTWTTCCIGVTESPSEFGTYVPYVTNSAVAFGIPSLPSRFYVIPQEFVGASRWVRVYCHSAGNPIVQVAATSVIVLRKG